MACCSGTRDRGRSLRRRTPRRRTGDAHDHRLRTAIVAAGAASQPGQPSRPGLDNSPIPHGTRSQNDIRMCRCWALQRGGGCPSDMPRPDTALCGCPADGGRNTGTGSWLWPRPRKRVRVCSRGHRGLYALRSTRWPMTGDPSAITPRKHAANVECVGMSQRPVTRLVRGCGYQSRLPARPAMPLSAWPP